MLWREPEHIASTSIFPRLIGQRWVGFSEPRAASVSMSVFASMHVYAHVQIRNRDPPQVWGEAKETKEFRTGFEFLFVLSEAGSHIS